MHSLILGGADHSHLSHKTLDEEGAHHLSDSGIITEDAHVSWWMENGKYKS